MLKRKENTKKTLYFPSDMLVLCFFIVYFCIPKKVREVNEETENQQISLKKYFWNRSVALLLLYLNWLVEQEKVVCTVPTSAPGGFLQL